MSLSVFDFPIEEYDYCEICGIELEYHERLGICYACEMEISEDETE